jgi:proteasome lid subunit RPN8/RPN11
MRLTLLSTSFMLRLGKDHYLEMIGHALDGLPEEACGLFAAPLDAAEVRITYRCRNTAASARLYEVDPMDHLKADRDAEAKGLQIIGVYHSHTHTDAYPSPTDIAQAPDPDWHYLIVSLREPEPVIRSYRIVDGHVAEEPVVVEDR